MSTPGGSLRISEFARRVGVSPDLLRAWERRYGLLRPMRSAGGFRLYTDEDAARVARMRRALGEGLSAAQAASSALEDTPPAGSTLEAAAARLLDAISRYDEAAAQAVIDESLATFALDTVLRDVIMPTLTQVGLAWEQGTLEISHEHFASNVIRGRLLALARLWGRGTGPLALLACGPGEEHDISLIAFGLLLRSYGWRILFLGADTPISTLTQTAETTKPDLVILASFNATLLEAHAAALRRLAKRTQLALSGPGATEPLSAKIGAQRLDGDLIAAAESITRLGTRSTGPVPDPR